VKTENNFDTLHGVPKDALEGFATVKCGTWSVQPGKQRDELILS
jgi:hypothetical protein